MPKTQRLVRNRVRHKKKYYEDNPEAREKQSEAIKKYYEDNPEAREKARETMKKYYVENPEAVKRGEENPMFGKTGAEHHGSKKVHQYERDGKTFIKEWDSIVDVERELIISNGNICHVCRGTKKTAGGFVWRYAN
jgi:hypothetical protein